MRKACFALYSFLAAMTLVTCLGAADARAQNATATAPLVKQDSSDCDNTTVSGSDVSRVGGDVSISQTPAGATTVTVRYTRGTANTAYELYWKCVKLLGTVRTEANGQGTGTFTFDAPVGKVLTFDSYPAGAPAGNKFQSVKVALSQRVPPAYVQRFAPELRMDRAAKGFPMSAQPFYENVVRWQSGAPFTLVENTNHGSLTSGTIPTYYQARRFGNQIRINYWWFYGYQHPCLANEGSHNGDWENVMVTLTEDASQIAAVTYSQHDGKYTRIAGPRDAPCTPDGTGRCSGSYGFERSGTHPVVYAGKFAHGSYHDSNPGDPASLLACLYYGDFRNPASAADYLQTWQNLIDLDSDQESWIASDRNASWTWGPDGISNHPTQKSPSANMAMCEGSPTYAVKSAGCYKSECLAGDDQASEDCLKECKPGYDNAGLTCNKGKWPWEWSIYGRLTGGNKYGYGFTLPTRDVGLSRRRSNVSEWDLP